MVKFYSLYRLVRLSGCGRFVSVAAAPLYFFLRLCPCGALLSAEAARAWHRIRGTGWQLIEHGSPIYLVETLLEEFRKHRLGVVAVPVELKVSAKQTNTKYQQLTSPGTDSSSRVE
eukprot:4275188-Pyramimonas_sp.AAC.1